MKIIPSLLFAFGFFLASASRTEAHAFLDSAEPAVGSTVSQSPSIVKLWFTRHLKSGPSAVQVFSGKDEVDLRDVKVDPDDPTLLTVSLPKLSAGTYQVAWKAVCIDTHSTHGSFTFKVTAS